MYSSMLISTEEELELFFIEKIINIKNLVSFAKKSSIILLFTWA
jgi:hypothetical protein